MNNKSKKCILMVRVSTEQQSFDAQMDELYALAKASGYQEEQIACIAEKESGIRLSEEERAGLNKMKELIETGEYDCVFAWEISRIARRKKILFSISEYLIDHKIQLIIKEPSLHLLKDDGSIDEGAETIFTLYAQLAEAEMRNKLARFARAKAEGFEKGKFEGGRVTLGYKVNHDGYWEIDEEGAKLIRLIFELYNSGEYSITSLAQELLARGYFRKTYPKKAEGEVLSTTSVKNRIWQILRNPLYLGGVSTATIAGRKRINRNNYPQIVDQETWDKCAKKREENRTEHRGKPQLLSRLIHCKCGSAYTLNLVDGCYTCRVKHNGVEKGIAHSPNVHANLIESLSWYVALQELHADRTQKTEDMVAECLQGIELCKEKIKVSKDIIHKLNERKKNLDDKFFVELTLNENQYNEYTQIQRDKIAQERTNIANYNAKIDAYQEQIKNSTTFDEMFDALRDSFEAIKAGTDTETMRAIIRRYIKNILIEPLEGKETSFWKIARFELYDDEERQKLIEGLKKQGHLISAIVLGTTFYLDCHHYRAYWDKTLQHEVPIVLLDRIHKTRHENRKNRVRKPTTHKQYE